jgi:uncharacterized protein YabN with tetrapyrrole methylase and pyrophosphatase domain
LTSKLTVVGTGIKSLDHITQETHLEISSADIVFDIVSDPLTQLWLQQKHPEHVSLNRFYSETTNRIDTYNSMVDEILKPLREGKSVCVVSYGHPGVFAYPMHESIRRAKLEGYSAKMLPGISAEDCLFADLLVDPGSSGCQSFEATDFLIFKRQFDTSCSLVLWQIGVIGISKYKKSLKVWNLNGVKILSEYLCNFYSSDHLVTVYEAGIYSASDPKIIIVPLSDLSLASIGAIATLYIPPSTKKEPDLVLLARLKLEMDDLSN